MSHPPSTESLTPLLLLRAQKKLQAFANDPKRLLSYPSNIEPKYCKPIDPHKLLHALLQYAPNESGRRYVAVAICECVDTAAMVDLANSWLRYVLIPLKGNSSMADFSPSDVATPTYEGTTEYDWYIQYSQHEPTMDKLVRMRDGYQCLLTEVYLEGVAPPDADQAPLDVSHIIKRAIGVFDSQKDQGSLLTWNILQNYMGWDATRTQAVIESLNTPLNGLLLLRNYRFSWDNFVWSLKPVLGDEGQVIPNTYDIEVMRALSFPDGYVFKPGGHPINRRLVFQDRGAHPAVQHIMPKRDIKIQTRPRPMPDPELISLHRALSWVLHTSGAAEVIGSVFADADGANVEVPSRKVRTTDELDILLSSLSLRSAATLILEEYPYASVDV